MSAPNAWGHLDPAVRTLITTGTFPNETYRAGTVVLSAQNGDGRAAATAFLIMVGPLPPAGTPEFFLVTARHVVLDAMALGLQLEALVVRGYDVRKPIQDRVKIALDPQAWSCNDDSDVAMMPFPVDQLPPDHCLSAIPNSELFSRKFGVSIPHGAELSAHGRWSVQGGADIVIERKVTLASFERPKAEIQIGGARQGVHVFLADGMVSRGMSGGPVTYSGSGWGGSGVVGLIHGYWPLGPEDVFPPATVQAIQDRAAAWTEIRLGIAAINSGVFFIIPIHDLEALLTRAGYPHELPVPTSLEQNETGS